LTSNPYQAYPSMPAGSLSRLVEPPPVELIAAGPARQRRLTVGFRFILAVPHLFVLFFLSIAGFVVTFLGWWGALFTGRLPGFCVSYLSGVARWYARVYGYLYLLTDVYPPFTFDDDPGYPVRVAIPERQRLNRFAVFFRFILMIWGNIVVGVVVYGASTIVAFVAWLITLITGKLPAPLHLAYTAVLRYQVRYYCYVGLLTPTYPWKLFGDEAGVPAPATDAPGYGTPPAYGTPSGYGGWPGYGTPGSVYGGQAGYGAAPAGWPPAGSPTASWRLVLPRSAKALLIVFIALGLITQVGTQVWSSSLRNREFTRATAIADWNNADSALNASVARWQTSLQSCDQSLACVTEADSRAASAMFAFVSQVQAIAMPSAAATAALTQAVSDAGATGQDFTTLSEATTVAQYQSDVTATGLRQDLARVQADLNNVANALDNS
jgi:Domain of unknown function (DUF4389)